MKIECLKLEDTTFDGRDNYWYYHPVICKYVDGPCTIGSYKKDQLRRIIESEEIEMPDWMVRQVEMKVKALEGEIEFVKKELAETEIECKRLKGVLS